MIKISDLNPNELRVLNVEGLNQQDLRKFFYIRRDRSLSQNRHACYNCGGVNLLTRVHVKANTQGRCIVCGNVIVDIPTRNLRGK